MTIANIITTLFGAFIFPVLLRLIWAPLVNLWGAKGGILSAVLITGTMWVVNHGIRNPLIVQSGNIWIDMSWAAALGVFTATLLLGANFKKSIPLLFTSTIGGIFAGFILYFIK